MEMDDARTLVRACLVELGVDVREPIEVQKDLAFLRDHRLASEKLGLATKLTVLGLVITGAASLIWVGVQVALGK